MSSCAIVRKTLSNRTMDLTFGITLGAAGVVAGINPTDNDGFDGTTPITSSGAGVYVLKLNRGAQRILSFRADNKQAAAYSAAAAVRGTNWVDNVAGATPTITFTMVNSAGAATQPAVGDKLYVTLTVKR
jgi:hypothetical protein